MGDLSTELTGLRRSPLAHSPTVWRRLPIRPSCHSRRCRSSRWWVSASTPGPRPRPAWQRCWARRCPPRVARSTGTDSHDALWLGPDEWLVVASTDPVALADQLTAAVGEEPRLVLDLSANRTVLELTGPRARAVLEKGCPVDLHPRSFGPGRAVSTTLARVPLLLCQTGEDTYRLLPRSSFADYVARWLLDAMVEFTG